MMGRLDRDELEEKKCYDARYGQKFKSFRIGLQDGKRDAKAGKHLEKRTANPYSVPSEIWELLKKRARWEMGYQTGWSLIHQRNQKKKTKYKDK
jgi:hypothetical protein